MRRNIWSFIFITLFVSPPVVFSETVQATLDRLNRTYKTIGNVEVEFTQTVYFAGFDRQVTSTGKVFFKSGQMRWDYRTPHAQKIVVNGDQIIHYIPENQQVLKGSIKRRTGLPINLFSDLNQMDEIFHISLQNMEMTLTPKEAKSHTEKMVLTLSSSLVRGADLLIEKVVLHETNKNRSTFVFHHFQINQSFRVDPFILNIPEDVEVVEMP